MILKIVVETFPKIVKVLNNLANDLTSSIPVQDAILLSGV